MLIQWLFTITWQEKVQHYIPAIINGFDNRQMLATPDLVAVQTPNCLHSMLLFSVTNVAKGPVGAAKLKT